LGVERRKKQRGENGDFKDEFQHWFPRLSGSEPPAMLSGLVSGGRMFPHIDELSFRFSEGGGRPLRECEGDQFAAVSLVIFVAASSGNDNKLLSCLAAAKRHGCGKAAGR
jgi:hypothetical protein